LLFGDTVATPRPPRAPPPECQVLIEWPLNGKLQSNKNQGYGLEYAIFKHIDSESLRSLSQSLCFAFKVEKARLKSGHLCF